MREQLLCEEYGIDSVTLELTKLALIGAGEAASLSEHASLRLIDRTSDGRLVLAWLSDEAEAGNRTIEVPMDIFDAIADDQAWDTARLELTSGFFVDIMKLFVEPELSVPD